MTTRRSMLSPEDQGATFVELFFDLVFVFAVTEVTGAVAEHLTWQGVGRAVLIFWLVWWGWTQFTWALNPADTTHRAVRVGTLVATGIAFVMAAGVHDAFGENGGLWFAVPYIAVRLVGLGLYAAVAATDRDLRQAVVVFGSLSLGGMAAVAVGGFVGPGARGWWWLGAIALDLVAAGVGGRGGTSVAWQVRPGHFAERHGLFVIIALGESLIAAGTAVLGTERTVGLAVVTVEAVAITGLLWWTYFGWLHPALERALHRIEDLRAPTARDAFSVFHFPLIGGVIGVAVAFEEAIAHPDEALHGEVTGALAVGLALFLGGAAAAYARVSGRFLAVRAVITLGAVVGLLALGDPSPTLALAIAIGALVLIVAFERAPAR